MTRTKENYIIKGFVINIKLKKVYYITESLIGTVFSKLHKNKTRKKVSRDREVAIRRLFNTTVDKEKIYYGDICSVINLDGVDWLNLRSMDRTKYEIPPNLKASLIESEFIMIPSLHRIFLISKTSGVSRTQVKRFLEHAIPTVVADNIQVEIYEEKSHSYIEEMQKLSTISKVQVTISKSNNDNTKKSAKIVENLLEETEALLSQLSFQSPNGGTLNTDSQLIGGALELAKSNGEAIIKGADEHGSLQTINTKDHVEKFEVDIENESTRNRDIFRRLKELFRNQNEQ